MTLQWRSATDPFTSCTLRPMKEMREKKIAAYLDVTARVSNAKRAVRRADVVRVLFTASQP
jgi:hypothetical protein